MDNRPLSFIPISIHKQCSPFCAFAFGLCSTNVRLVRTACSPYQSRAAGQFLTDCSICSTLLYPTELRELFYSQICSIRLTFSLRRKGEKVSNKSNRIENILSIPYIPKPNTVRPYRTFVEHLSNTVRQSLEQQHEHHRLLQPTVPNAVRRSIWSGSILFDSLPNKAMPTTTMALAVFTFTVRFVRPVFTPPAQSPAHNKEQPCLNK